MRYALLFAFVLMIGCDQYEPNDPRRSMSYDGRWVNSMSYYKDQRTGLCFAAEGIGSHSATLTYVPCTPEVEKLIKDSK